jgi:glycosyltransferase involved in cell wall biosynthesis
MTKNHGRPDDPEGAQREPRGEQRSRAERPPLVSVVVPCYNQARFLGEAIESVLAQSHPLFEVVVVDDGSTDDTSEVAARYPGVRLVRQENRGLSGARNAGLARSRGEYVVFLDADDRLLPGALEAGVERLEARPACAFVSGHYRFIAVDGSFLRQEPERIVGKDRYAALLQLNYIGPPAVVMYRRAVFESVGAFDSSVNPAADYDLYLRIARRFAVSSHEKVVAEYRQHGTNMTRSPAPMLSATIAVLRSQRKHLKGHEQYKEAYRTGVMRYQGNYGDRLVDELSARVKKREWKKVLPELPVLLRYYPQGIALLLLNERRVERRRLARRLLLRKRELDVHEQGLKELEGVQETDNVLVRERQEVQRLRKRTQGLERRIRKLDQRALTGRNGKVQKFLERLGGVRAKAPRR